MASSPSHNDDELDLNEESNDTVDEEPETIDLSEPDALVEEDTLDLFTSNFRSLSNTSQNDNASATREEDYVLQFPYIPDTRIVIGNKTLFDKSCTICLNNFGQAERIRKLQCGHLFHVNCIDKWFCTLQNCPICRGTVTFNSYSEQVNEAITSARSTWPDLSSEAPITIEESRLNLFRNNPVVLRNLEPGRIVTIDVTSDDSLDAVEIIDGPVQDSIPTIVIDDSSENPSDNEDENNSTNNPMLTH